MTPRELAAAIRKGAAMRPQGFLSGTSRKGDGTSCALQAAAEAITGALLVTVNACERALGIDCDMAFQIYTRNDSGMTREAIADWLDTLEPETKPADKQSFDAFMATVMKPVPVTA